MRSLPQLRVFLFSFLFTISMITFLVFTNIIERISIVFITLIFYKMIINIKKSNWKYLWIIIIAIFIGWVLCFFALWQLKYENTFINPTAPVSNTRDTAVLLIFTGEASQYDVPIYLKNIFDRRGIGEKLYLPYELYKKKRAYEYIGNSKFSEISNSISKQLVHQMNNHYDIYISYLNDKPYYDEVANQILLKENYKKVIIVPISLMQSTDYIRAVSQLGVYNLYRSKAIIKCTTPLWDSEKIAKSIANKISVVNGDDKKSNVGIILLNESIGRVKTKEMKPQNINYNVLFMEKVKGFLISKGFEHRKIRYLEWYPHEEEIKDMIRQLQEYGVGKIFIVSAGDISSPIDQKHIMMKLMEGVEEVKMHYIDGWGEDASLIEELENRIRLLNVQP